jgi:hypothetical protein
MPAIQVRSQVSLDELLNGIAQLETQELDHLINRALTLRARRIAPSLRQSETKLLRKINRGLPPTIQQRYNDLTVKRREETLTPAEHDELLTLIDRIERADAERAQALTNLAQLREVPVTALMTELGIQPPSYA